MEIRFVLCTSVLQVGGSSAKVSLILISEGFRQHSSWLACMDAHGEPRVCAFMGKRCVVIPRRLPPTTELRLLDEPLSGIAPHEEEKTTLHLAFPEMVMRSELVYK